MTILLALAVLVFSGIPSQPEVWKVTRNEGGGRRAGRILFAPDPILLKLIEEPDFVPDWEKVTPDENGTVSHLSLRNGWAYGEYESDGEIGRAHV